MVFSVIKKILIDQLKPGMYISDLNNQWVPTENASRKGLLKFASTIAKIKSLGVTEVYIDTEKGDDCPEGEIADTVKQLQANQFKSLRMQSGTQSEFRISADQERVHAQKRYSQAKSLVGDILVDIKKGKGIDAQAVDDTASGIIESLQTNENALRCLSFIRSKDEYLLEHSVNVGVLMGIFARSLRIEESITKQLVSGALLHDIGKVLVPNEVLNKPGKLDAEEWEEMKRHVSYGEQILDVTAGLSDLTRSICRLHHERLDGSGYPRNLPAEQITRYGRMAAICDVFDAVTADRVYHDGISPNQTLKKLIEWSVFHLDKDLVYDFIRCLSAYPVGELVELSDNTAAIIIEANRRRPKLPIVRAFFQIKTQSVFKPYVVNLASDTNTREILSTLDSRELGINIQPYI